MGILSNNNINNDQELMANFHFPTSKKALIVFTRNPELGKCKTRLAKTVGDEAALNIYKHLLRRTAEVSKQVNADRFVFYSETIIENDIWELEYFRKKLQQGSDLGQRMHNAFSELFQAGYEKICIIGSDLFDLNAQLVQSAYEKLDEHDTVIGPAEDGGYYLLAMTKMQNAIFKNKDWGTENVKTETLKDLQNSNVLLLKELNDIDTFEDMKHHEELKIYCNNQNQTSSLGI